jgi:hypothetical protein
MAARRLVIVMLVLLGLSTLAAALVPGPDRSTPAGSDTIDTRPGAGSGPGAAPASGARFVQRRLRISATPAVVEVRPGDQLRLAVVGPYGDDITIPAFGLTETLTPYAPARFDLLVPDAGSFPILAVQSGRLIGRIRSRPAPEPCPQARRRARQGRSRPQACPRRGRPAASAGGRSDPKP